MKHQFKTPYDGEDHRVRKTITDPSLAKQSFAQDCDINLIMARYQSTTMVDHVNSHQGNYDDYTKVQDYHSSLLQVMEAQEAFNELPSKIRSRFQNDPGQFLAYATNPENKEGMEELGLLPKKSPIEQGSDRKSQATEQTTTTSPDPTGE